MGNSSLIADSRAKPSYDEVFNRHLPRLLWMACRLLGDRMEAEDIVMKVFVKYWHRQDQFANEIAASSFLAISTKNACPNHIRNSKRNEQQKKLFTDAQQLHEDILEQMAVNDSINQAWSIVAGLPEACRHVFVLCYIK